MTPNLECFRVKGCNHSLIIKFMGTITIQVQSMFFDVSSLIGYGLIWEGC